jgi:ankyrin repeat protein
MFRPRLFFAALSAAFVCSLAVHSAQDPTPATDASGATPLMYAAAFESIEELRAQLDRGADVNASADNGATALMWAADDPAKLELLLDRGAAINATAADGTTALVAAVHRSNTESMRLLLHRGAAPGSSLEALLQAAYANASPEPRRLLRSLGIKATHIGQVAPALMRLDHLEIELLRELLELGLDANTKMPFVTVQFPIAGYIAFTGDSEMMRLAIERGADVNIATSRGNTPLMMAAASSNPNPAMITLLLERGARVDAADDKGRTALDWALMQGDTEIARALKKAGARQGSPTAAAAMPRMRPRSVHDAMRNALATMDTIGPAFNTRNRCVSCHNQSLPAVARRLASARGIPLAPDVVAHPTQATQAFWNTQRNGYMLGRCGGGGFVQNAGYGLTSMAAEGAPRTRLTDATASCLATRQYPDGSWPAIDVRPPLGGSPTVFTALAVRGLDIYTPPALRPQVEPRIARARSFMRNATANDTQDAAFKVLGLVWSKASAADVAASVEALRGRQRPDGGWSQVSTMTSDAYATGQALYALATSGVPASDPAYTRGTNYLLRTQLSDGSWFVKARGFPFQPYFDYGFPHGTDQFISAAATSWAVIGLAH